MNPSNLHKTLTERSGSKWQLEFKSKTLNIKEIVVLDVEPLLSEDTIRAIRAKAEANRTFTHGHIKNQYLFSRMIQCQHCGYAMFGQTNHNGFKYYRHAHAVRDRQCPGAETKSWIPATDIEDAAMRHLFETFGNPSAVQRAIKEATPNAEDVRAAAKRFEFVTGELEKLGIARKRILGLIVKGAISDDQVESDLKELRDRETGLKAEQTRLEDELAHVPQKAVIASFSKFIAGKFRQYTNARLTAKTRHANEAFEEMTYAEKRKLCETVFSGKTAEGKRMGIRIAWDKTGRKWGYQIDGHFIAESGPVNKAGFVFGAPHEQKALVTKFANY